MGTVMSTSTSTRSEEETAAQADQSFTDLIDCGRYCTEIEACSRSSSRNEIIQDDDILEGEYIINQIHNNDNTRSRRKCRLDERMDELFPSSNFDLDRIHPHEPPYLGTSYWQHIPTNSPTSKSITNMNITTSPMAPSTPPRTIEHPTTNKLNTPPTSPLISPSSLNTPSKLHRRPMPIISPLQNNSPDEKVLSPFLLHNAHTISTPRVRSLGDSSSSTIRTSTTTSTIVTESSPVVSFTPRRLFGDREELLLQQHDSDDADWDGEEDNLLNQPSLQPSNGMSEAAMVAASRADFCGEVEYSNSLYHVHQALDGSSSTPPPSPPRNIHLNRRTNNNNNIQDNNNEQQERPSLVQHSNPQYNDDEESIITFRNGVLVKKTICSPSKSSRSLGDASRTSTLTTLHIPDGRRKSNRQHVNSLPSLRVGKPIRLRVTESYAGYSSPEINLDGEGNGDNASDSGNGSRAVVGGGGGSSDGTDALNTSGNSLLTEEEAQQFFSYDPYFSLGEYTVTTPSGRSYGNGLSVKMGEQYMTLQDWDGRVWAVTRSRHTFVPSSVIYSPKPRYTGQIASSHRPYSERGEGVEGAVDLYPWAIIKKDGRRMDHDATIHLVSTNTMELDKKKLLGGMFNPQPSFRSRHGFDENGSHSHTMVYRVEPNEDGGCDGNNDGDSCQEVPCCILLRDEVKRDVFDVTIAPGIDPLLIICYMAVHSKMDVEPKLCDQ